MSNPFPEIGLSKGRPIAQSSFLGDQSRTPVMDVAPMFTLGSALRWLGHACPGPSCSGPLHGLPASIWFLLNDCLDRPFGQETRVLVDLPTDATVGQLVRVIIQINGCIRGDAIEVGYRPGVFDEGSEPTQVDLAAIAFKTSRGPRP